MSPFFFVISGGLYFIFGSGPVSNWVLGTLEYRYPAFYLVKDREEAKTIVVLAGYVVADPIFPLSSRVNGATLFRLSEAFMVWRERPTAKLILAGPADMTGVMEGLLLGMGVPKSAVIKASKSRNTMENLRSLNSILDGQRFILVTSAGHMPRAMMLAKRFRLDPVPAPTDYLTSTNPWLSSWMPTPAHLELSDLAAHEYLSMAYYYFFNPE
jgi:uncharacterized SAM-binding protein YcdF (DUF218 family)